MESLSVYIDFLTLRYGFWGIALIIATLTLFCFQLWYYFSFYSRIPRYGSYGKVESEQEEGVSVIVLLGDNFWYIENTLPRLLAQAHPKFEIVVVEVGTTEDFTESLNLLKDTYRNLVSTRMDMDRRFPISNKMAYNVGIKAASYNRIILTTDDAVPVSAQWLSTMSAGFQGGDVVLGYCGIEKKEGLLNKMIRCSRLAMSSRYLASAIGGKPYRGIIHNIGLTKEIYFAHKGFDHLNMNAGEDDLFIQRIADAQNTAVVMTPHATVRETHWGDLHWWRGRRKFNSVAERYYPVWVKASKEWELGTRLLFCLATLVLIAMMPLEIKCAALVLFLLRAAVVRYKFAAIRRRLGEPGLGWAFMLYDLWEPLSEIGVKIGGRIKAPAGVWR